MNETEKRIFSVLSAPPAERKAKKPSKRPKKKIPVNKSNVEKGEKKAEKKVEGVKKRPKHHKPKPPPKREKRKSLFVKPKKAKKSIFNKKKTADQLKNEHDRDEKKKHSKLGRPYGPKKGGYFDKSGKKQDADNALTAEEIEKLSNKVKGMLEKSNVDLNHKAIFNNFNNQLKSMMKQYK